MARKDSDSNSRRFAPVTALERAAEAHEAEVHELAMLRQVLLQTGEENLRLHRRTMKTIQSMRREMERFKRALKALGTAR